MNNSTQNVGDYLNTINRLKMYLLIPFTVITICSIIISIMIPAVYKSSSTILIEGQPITAAAGLIGGGITSGVETIIESTKQQLMSREKLEGLIRKFDLYKDAIEGRKKVPKGIIATMRENISIEFITRKVINPKTGYPALATIAFEVTFEGTEPEKVYNVAKELSTIYLEQNKINISKKALGTASLLDNELKNQENKTNEMKNTITEFRIKHSKYLPEKIPQYREIVGRIEMELARLDSETIKAKEKLNYMERNQNPYIQNLKKLKQELNAKETTLSSKHPDIIKLKKAIRGMEKDLGKGKKKDADPLYQAQLKTARVELKILRKGEANTIAKLEEYQKFIKEASKIENEYQLILIDYENSRLQYQKLSDRVMEAKALGGIGEGDAGRIFSILEPASFPQKPFKPKRLIIVIIGLVIGMTAGICITAAKEFFDESIWSADSLMELSNKPVLAMIPEIDMDKLHCQEKEVKAFSTKEIHYNQTPVLDLNMNAVEKNKLVSCFNGNFFSDQYGILKAKILEKAKSEGINTILVTSPIKGEGKSLTAANLAVALAKEHSNTVLLVDADFRKPSLHKLFEINSQGGLSDYFINGTPLENLFVNPGVEKLLFLPEFLSVENSAEVISSSKMDDLVKELKERYPDRYVIFDAPPLNGLSDSLILSKYVDGVILVVENGRTKRSEVASSLKSLEDRNFLGFVLNKAEISEKRYYYGKINHSFKDKFKN